MAEALKRKFEVAELAKQKQLKLKRLKKRENN